MICRQTPAGQRMDCVKLLDQRLVARNSDRQVQVVDIELRTEPGTISAALRRAYTVLKEVMSLFQHVHGRAQSLTVIAWLLPRYSALFRLAASIPALSPPWRRGPVPSQPQRLSARFSRRPAWGRLWPRRRSADRSPPSPRRYGEHVRAIKRLFWSSAYRCFYANHQVIAANL